MGGQTSTYSTTTKLPLVPTPPPSLPHGLKTEGHRTVFTDKVEGPGSEPRGFCLHVALCLAPAGFSLLPRPAVRAALQVSYEGGQGLADRPSSVLLQGQGTGMCSPLHAQDSSCCSLSQKGTHFPSLHLPRSKHTVSSAAFPGGGHSLLFPESIQWADKSLKVSTLPQRVRSDPGKDDSGTYPISQ